MTSLRHCVRPQSEWRDALLDRVAIEASTHRRHLIGVDVLIVDDDRDVADLLADLLEGTGETVRVAYGGEQGLAALRERRPDLVLLDVEMPALSGPAVAYRMFVENTGLEDIPVVLLSGVFDLEKVAERVGTPYYLAKPYSMDDLLAMVHRAETEHRVPVPAH